MGDNGRFIKTVQTKSGNIYVYLTRDNSILQIDRAWYENVPFAKREIVLIESMEENGIKSDVGTIKFELEFAREELWPGIEHSVKALTLEVTQQCSLRCTYCIYSGNYKNERVHSSSNMSRAMLKKSIDYYYDHSTEEKDGNISFYGGESLLRWKEIAYSIEYARSKWKEKPLTFQISTNGTTLTEPVIQWLDRQKDTSIQITCNGNSQDRYRIFPSGQGSLSTVMENVKRISKAYPDLWKRTNFIANITSARELLELRKFYISEIGKPPMSITGIKEEFGNSVIHQLVHTKDTDEDKEEVMRLFCEDDPYVRPYYDVDRLCVRRVESEPQVTLRTSFCRPLSHSLYISAEGRFSPCVQFCSTIDLGDVDTGYSREKIIHILDLVKEVFDQRCSDCWARRLCTICFAMINKDDRGNLFLPVSSCEEEKNRITEELRVFCEIRERNPEFITKIREKYIRHDDGTK